MNSQQPTTGVVMTSASMVLIPRDDPVGKLVFVVIVLALGLLFFVALMALLTALMPRASARNRAALERTPWLAFLAGMAISLVLGGVAGYLFSGSYVRLLLKTEWIYPRLIGGIALSAVLLIAASFGATGTVACVGQRLAALAGRELSALRKSIWGALFLALASWFPLTGWLVVAPAAFMMSLGAAVLGRVQRDAP